VKFPRLVLLILTCALAPASLCAGTRRPKLTGTWRLSGDRKTLTHTAVMKGEFGEEEVRLVYRRAV
jgi:hypothetical protein